MTFLKKLFSDNIKPILLAILIALFIRTFIFQITEVYGQSMYPTLTTSDKLFTLKINYIMNEPTDGDIVILNAPDKENTYYVKRIIAAGGEHIKISDGRVYVNGNLLKEPYINNSYTPGYIDTIIPEDAYFVMGDNRTNSHDSRSSDVSFISESAIKGKAVFKIWPFEGIGLIK